MAEPSYHWLAQLDQKPLSENGAKGICLALSALALIYVNLARLNYVLQILLHEYFLLLWATREILVGDFGGQR